MLMLTIRTIRDEAVVRFSGLPPIMGRRFVALTMEGEPLTILWVHPDVDDADELVAANLACYVYKTHEHFEDDDELDVS